VYRQHNPLVVLNEELKIGVHRRLNMLFSAAR
jgi:hypothetical protein